MKKEVRSWYSERIGKEMPIAVYGHYGRPVLLFPTWSSGCEEYEQRGLLEAIRSWIDQGQLKVFVVESLNNYTWGNPGLHPGERARRHAFYDAYVRQEVVPFIWTHQQGQSPILAGGASMGALFAMNSLLRYPDAFEGIIGMSGSYDLSQFIGDYVDPTVQAHAPLHLVASLDEGKLGELRAKRHIHLLTGQGPHEAPDMTRRMGAALAARGIPAQVDVWGHDMAHDWPTWHRMLPHVLSKL